MKLNAEEMFESMQSVESPLQEGQDGTNQDGTNEFLATLNDPKGSVCGRCGNPNLFADELGWFFWHKDNKTPIIDHVNFVAVCKTCYISLGLSGGER